MAQDVKTDKLIGQTLDGKYKIEALIARGGMAKVYKSLQINLNRNVAIKVLDPKHVDADDPEFRKRFELEAQMTSQLNHPNTVTIHDYGYSEKLDVFYFVMEFIQGKTLRREMKQVGEFPVDRALYVSQQIARSVRQAHSVGVVHRDLKPSNVLLTTHDEDRDWVKVVDFGLLKLKKESLQESSKGVLMGSPRYMSPEQIKRSDLDHRTDVYSLGVNLYQMLAGRAPFVGQRAMDILMGHINNAAPQISSITERDDISVEVEAFALTL
ncbi:MAG: serine/threonine protein kinase, partial [Deltaproteobacteria bacterium]|nr:serine/threonine protein kinase [Deltaproteobacteria bacterium]